MPTVIAPTNNNTIAARADTGILIFLEGANEGVNC